MKDTIIVAHRGLSSLYPENTLLSIEQAMAVGARAIEFDIQMTSDHVPVLYHDTDLMRMTGQPGLIMDKTLEELNQYRASYPDRFGEQYSGTPISPLTDAIALFELHPMVTPCIEIKKESVEHFGLKRFVDTIVTISNRVIDRTIFLSFNYDVIAHLHSMGLKRTGWVLENLDDDTRQAAEDLQPGVLICSIKKLPITGEVFWPGPWQWMVYQTEDPDVIRKYIAQGADYIETDNIKVVVQSMPELFDEQSGSTDD